MFTKDAAANLRKKDDSYNSAIGGAFAGSMLGLKCAWTWILSFTLQLANTDIRPDRSAPAVLGYGAALSVVLAAFTFTGGKLTGYERDPTVDEVSRKEYLRKNRRRPVDEIVNELGEGRGMNMIFRVVARESELGSLTCTQESLLLATRSVGPSASRPTTALTCRSPLRRRYVPYTQQYYSPCSKVLALPRAIPHYDLRSEDEQYLQLRLRQPYWGIGLESNLVSVTSEACRWLSGLEWDLGRSSKCLINQFLLYYLRLLCKYQALNICQCSRKAHHLRTMSISVNVM
jgi:hypothetical protein